MKTARLYHATDPNFGVGPRPAFPSGYGHVADVRVRVDEGYCVQQALEDVWTMTQHLDAQWPRPAERHLITLHAGRRTLRSTSMGDIAELDRRYYETVGLGWRDITDEIRQDSAQAGGT